MTIIFGQSQLELPEFRSTFDYRTTTSYRRDIIIVQLVNGQTLLNELKRENRKENPSIAYRKESKSARTGAGPVPESVPAPADAIQLNVVNAVFLGESKTNQNLCLYLRRPADGRPDAAISGGHKSRKKIPSDTAARGYISRKLCPSTSTYAASAGPRPEIPQS
ncbi:hypothetical protein EVAR_46423_1 [Eumeta japonica]|uniref:Uncharacterized protein n=1 Tax=Eumeta variegata TaxID=151549 RepID=A0A4C1XF10_EUMVA|nr:hypothetical protein EVAR_46423_1 [Eumeta japonica]